MWFEKAKILLDTEYSAYYQKATTHAQKVMDEKKCHSYQVLGVGNYLLKHETAFQNCTLSEIQRLKATVLLHDLGRFYEVFLHEDGGKVDHGVYGASLLAKYSDFNRFDIVLSVRHHGHLIEKLYEDADYVKLSAEEQLEIQKIIYLVRDADKVANFYLLSRHFKEMENLFFLKSLLNCQIKEPCPLVWDAFMKHTAVDLRNVKSFADQAVMYLACVYDLAYVSSFVLINKLDILPKLLDCFDKFLTEDYASICRHELLIYAQNRMNGNGNLFRF